MKVLVDACIWSLALRRGASKDHRLVKELSELIKEVRVQIIGPIRQELLSGVKSQKQFNELSFIFQPFLIYNWKLPILNKLLPFLT
jgi:hypothetical protein